MTESYPFPPIAKVRQSYDQPEVIDVPEAVAKAVRESRITTRFKPGGSVALTVGSRGIAGIDVIARSAVDALRGLGFRPFIVAAMGSHGGGTPEGQKALLAELGVTEASMGCELRSEMDTVVLGTNRFGLPVYFDRNAYQADGIVLLNRVKPHTSFTGRYESGLLKMLAIGLGKREGAAQVHKLGLPGLKALLPEVGAFLLKTTPVSLGIALLENAREQTARIVGVEPEDLLEVEPKLLDDSRALMARLPFDQLDVLVVGELGKNYSGTGLDPNVIGRQRVETMPDLPRPVVTRLAVLALSAETRGNALGIGLADLTTDKVVAAIDPTPMRVNSLTSNFLTRARVPISLPTDHEVVAACLDTCWRTQPSEARAVFIPNTLELTTMWVTQPLAHEVRSNPGMSFETGFVPPPFDSSGTLDLCGMFPESIRARDAGRDSAILDPVLSYRSEETAMTTPPEPEVAAEATAPRAAEPPVWPYVVPLAGFLALTALEGYLPSGPNGTPNPVWYPVGYSIKLALVVALLWVSRTIFRDLDRPSPGKAALAIAVGLGVTAVWVGSDGRYPMIPWLGKRVAFDPSALSRPALWAFVSVRMVGLVVIVPLVEELFYRSFLMRWIVDPVYTRVPIGHVTPLGLAVTTLVFAGSHPEWLPAVLTGLAWGLLVWQTKSVTACVISHATANLALGVYVLVTGDWKFW